jgi:hypothetical protein
MIRRLVMSGGGLGRGGCMSGLGAKMTIQERGIRLFMGETS